MKDPALISRGAGKTQWAVARASTAARHGQLVVFLTSDPSATRKLVLAHNQGAWPIGLRIKGV